MSNGQAQPRWLWWANTIAVAIAAVALGYMLASGGGATLVAVLRSSAPAVAAVIGLDLLAVAARSRALHILLRPSQRMIRFPRVMATQAAAGAVQDLTPTGALGDVVKATLLLTRVPATEVVSAVVAYDVLAVYVSTFVVTTGVVVAAALGVVPAPYDQALWATAVALLVLVIVASWLIRRGLACTLVAASARVRIITPARRERWVPRLTLLDERLRALHARGRSEPRQAFALLLLGRAIGWLELYVLMRAVGVSPDASTFVAVVLIQMPVARLGTLLPLGIGITDLGTAGVFALVGLPPNAGAAVAMLNRVRQIAVGSIGLGAMVVLQAIDRITLHRTRARLRRQLAEDQATSASTTRRAAGPSRAPTR